MVYYVGSIPFDGGLSHFGIMGMKWGVRRFQNRDGSLTLAGKARYGRGGEERSGDGWSAKTTKVYRKSPDASTTNSILRSSQKMLKDSAEIAERASRRRNPTKKFKSNVSKMSDDDLRKRVNRLNLERQYAQLTGEDTRYGAEVAREVLQTTGSLIGIASGALTIAMMAKKMKGA